MRNRYYPPELMEPRRASGIDGPTHIAEGADDSLDGDDREHVCREQRRQRDNIGALLLGAHNRGNAYDMASL